MVQKLKPLRNSFYGTPAGTSTDYKPAPLTGTNRAPTSGDTGYELGQEWIYAGTIYELASVSAGVATWEITGGGTGAVSTLGGDTGIAAPVGGKIDLLGTANQIGTSSFLDAVTFSLASALIAPGSLEVTSGFSVDGGAITMASGTNAINISADAAATTVNFATGAGVKTLTLGSSNGASITSIACGTGGIGVGTSAVAHSSTFGGTTGNSATSIACGTGGCALGASATDHTTTIGSVTGVSSTVLQSGTSGLSLTSTTAGLVAVTTNANSSGATTVAINSRVGHATFTGQTTAAAASIDVTITNTLLTDTTQSVMVTACNLGSNDAQMTIQRVNLAIGSIVVTLKNNGAAALNGDIHVNFWLTN